MRVFTRIKTGLATEAPDVKTIMSHATYLNTHPAASGMRVKEGLAG